MEPDTYQEEQEDSKPIYEPGEVFYGVPELFDLESSAKSHNS